MGFSVAMEIRVLIQSAPKPYQTYATLFPHQNDTGTQLLIEIIARSIANTHYYGVSYARPCLLRMRRFTSRALER